MIPYGLTVNEPSGAGPVAEGGAAVVGNSGAASAGAASAGAVSAGAVSAGAVSAGAASAGAAAAGVCCAALWRHAATTDTIIAPTVATVTKRAMDLTPRTRPDPLGSKAQPGGRSGCAPTDSTHAIGHKVATVRPHCSSWMALSNLRTGSC